MFCVKKCRVCYLVWAVIANKGCTAFYAHCHHGFHGYESLSVKPQERSTPQRMRALLEWAFEQAYTAPSFKNIYRYMHLQQRHMNKSAHFAKMWERVLWVHPELDERVQFPVNQAARNIYRRHKFEEMAQCIVNARPQYTLMVGLDATEYSYLFLQIVQQFIREYGWRVVCVSGEQACAHWGANVFIDRDLVRHLAVDRFPMVFLVHMKNKALIRLGAGCTSLHELMHRIVEGVKNVDRTIHSDVANGGLESRDAENI